ncbi:hypothetical protein BDZ94DRAFT_1268116 [Collybia nuda]|uniref:Uncharacterized protein n=1 Tax=Collybia nuda TaxID=64659 RepID=A0A9P6CG26_9AGAR|nr:hypothetical protein BDZ94DRAFT_1268116 [Collybia nuda]
MNISEGHFSGKRRASVTVQRSCGMVHFGEDFQVASWACGRVPRLTTRCVSDIFNSCP